METIVVPLDLPCRDLSPNARVHWAKKAKAVKKYRMLARIAAQEAQAGRARRWPAATVQATFFFRDARRRDADNLLASLKAAFDGLTDSGMILDDAGLTHAPVRTRTDREYPRLVLEISQHERTN